MANVAQLVEPRFVVPVVVGSSPIVRPRLNNILPSWQVFLWANADLRSAQTGMGLC